MTSISPRKAIELKANLPVQPLAVTPPLHASIEEFAAEGFTQLIDYAERWLRMAVELEYAHDRVSQRHQKTEKIAV